MAGDSVISPSIRLAMCFRVPPLRLQFPICVLKMSESARSIGFGANRKVSIGSAEGNGCRSRAGVVRKKKSILGAADVRQRCSPETPQTPTRSARYRRIARAWMRYWQIAIDRVTVHMTGLFESIRRKLWSIHAPRPKLAGPNFRKQLCGVIPLLKDGSQFMRL